MIAAFPVAEGEALDQDVSAGRGAAVHIEGGNARERVL